MEKSARLKIVLILTIIILVCTSNNAFAANLFTNAYFVQELQIRVTLLENFPGYLLCEFWSRWPKSMGNLLVSPGFGITSLARTPESGYPISNRLTSRL